MLHLTRISRRSAADADPRTSSDVLVTAVAVTFRRLRIAVCLSVCLIVLCPQGSLGVYNVFNLYGCFWP